jgi:pyroglutamyl-peptidase
VRILVTGFGPFDTFSYNPSEVLAKALSEENEDVESIILPVIYGQAGKALLESLEEFDPDLIICFGLNGNISHVALEEIALNLRSSETPDSSGRVIEDQPITSEGQLAFKTGLPVIRIRKELRKKKIPSKLSYCAGTYLCNEVFYTLMTWGSHHSKRGGFLHIPMASELIADDPKSYSVPHMSMEMILQAGRIILAVSRFR